MKKQTTKDQITTYIRAGYPGLYVLSYEEARVQLELSQIAKEWDFRLYVWTVTKGIVDVKGKSQINDTQDPMAALDAFEKLNEKSLLIMEDLHAYLDPSDKNPQLYRRMKEVLVSGKASNRVLIIVAPVLNLPVDLEKEITVIDFKLPDAEQLRYVLEGIAKSAGLELNGNTEQCVKAASGCTTTEAENAYAKSVVEKGDIVPEIIAAEKAQTVKKNGLLEIIEIKVDRDSVGGLEILMDWITKRKAAFTQKAKDYGLPTPKGMLLVGIPGAGKSLVSKVVATTLDVPLVKLDAGKIFGSLVGQSEANMRSVISTVEAIAPCVLWIDEIEKGLEGSKSSGQTDGGVTARVLGTFLQWMQEKTAEVFVVATANNITALPPEFQRKGRWDELWFVDLPNRKEREAIWKIHIQKNGRKLKDFNVSKLAAGTDEWTGAEIEALFVESLFAAFDEDREPTTDSILELTKTVMPLSKTMGDQVNALRQWAQGRARMASAPEEIDTEAKARKLV